MISVIKNYMSKPKPSIEDMQQQIQGYDYMTSRGVPLVVAAGTFAAIGYKLQMVENPEVAYAASIAFALFGAPAIAIGIAGKRRNMRKIREAQYRNNLID